MEAPQGNTSSVHGNGSFRSGSFVGDSSFHNFLWQFEETALTGAASRGGPFRHALSGHCRRDEGLQCPSCGSCQGGCALCVKFVSVKAPSDSPTQFVVLMREVLERRLFQTEASVAVAASVEKNRKARNRWTLDCEGRIARREVDQRFGNLAEKQLEGTSSQCPRRVRMLCAASVGECESRASLWSRVEKELQPLRGDEEDSEGGREPETLERKEGSVKSQALLLVFPDEWVASRSAALTHSSETPDLPSAFREAPGTATEEDEESDASRKKGRQGRQDPDSLAAINLLYGSLFNLQQTRVQRLLKKKTLSSSAGAVFIICIWRRRRPRILRSLFKELSAPSLADFRALLAFSDIRCTDTAFEAAEALTVGDAARTAALEVFDCAVEALCREDSETLLPMPSLLDRDLREAYPLPRMRVLGSLRLGRGRCVLICGSSGAGKTLLLSALARLSEKDGNGWADSVAGNPCVASGTELFHSVVGASQRALLELFSRALSLGSAVFLDCLEELTGCSCVSQEEGKASVETDPAIPTKASPRDELQRDLTQMLEWAVEVFVRGKGVPLFCATGVDPRRLPPQLLALFTDFIRLERQ